MFTTSAGVLSLRRTLIALFSRAPNWAILTICIGIECSVRPYNVYSLLCSTKLVVSVTLKDNTNTLKTYWQYQYQYNFSKSIAITYQYCKKYWQY